MKKEFVTYEQSLALKELGFDERCFGHYNPNGVFFWKILCSDEDNDHTLSVKDIIEHIADGYVESPTYQQAFRFFREKYKQDYLIVPNGDSTGKTNGYYYEIVFDFSKENIESESFKTYEEAESACLDKLIEICKNNYRHYNGLPSTSSYDQ